MPPRHTSAHARALPGECTIVLRLLYIALLRALNRMRASVKVHDALRLRRLINLRLSDLV